MSEIWKPVPGYEGIYSVSDQGSVRTEDRTVTKVRHGEPMDYRIAQRLLKQASDVDGYRVVSLSNGGVHQTVKVHRLVLGAFVGPCPPGQQVCHGNGVRHDNRLSNLRYDTVKGNAADRYRHGTDGIGSKNPSATFTEDQIVEIRSTYAEGGVSYSDLVSRYGGSKTNMARIIKQKIWTHV